MVVYAFFGEVKKTGGFLTIFWYPGMLVCMSLAQEVTVTSFFLSLKDQGHDPGELAGVVAVVVAVGRVVELGSDVSFSVLKSIKTKSTLS